MNPAIAVLSIVAGIGGAAAAGSYGFMSYYDNYIKQPRKTHEERFGEWYKSFLQKNSSSSANIEFIIKGNNGKEHYCKKVENGQERNMTKEECDGIVKQKSWNENNNVQPQVWLRTDIDNMEEAFQRYFPGGSSLGADYPSKQEINFYGLTCFKDSLPSDRKIEMSCSHKGTRYIWGQYWQRRN
ncbi:hypothetical protein [Mycoplasma suis]|uniref:Uncharacterized protein n=1 Tax=Mycoplasma suis (strain Illinois) TaxID=768700 RepID=F0QQB7_MYCSL|nr:hypothetical protein [Mycoplasma suis]ADX97687.1 hypothetical protein MSU_0143 [Mycoplasma suis str. Illinois]